MSCVEIELCSCTKSGGLGVFGGKAEVICSRIVIIIWAGLNPLQTT